LRVIDAVGAGSYPVNSPETLHLMSQAFAIAFADRFAYLADPAFVEVPIARLLDDAYISGRAGDIRLDRIGSIGVGSPDVLGVTHELETSLPGYASGGSTTHLSVIDKDDVAVSLTQTLLSLWGSRVTVPGTGIILNNGMMWFDPEPGRPNSVAGGKIPLCNMAPALILREGTAMAALGASGGRRIMNAVAQIAMNLVDRGMPMQEAVSFPRIDRSTAQLFVSARMPETAVQHLRERGHDLAVKDEGLFFGEFSSPACVALRDGRFEGGVDPWYFPATAAGV
jgi:gamma-glutamyltranspeptidase/glutathione hydrolase